MAEPICEDEGLLQEWTPQTQLLQQIPLKTQRGLFPQNLSLTCLDVSSDYIALGTNLGFVYWYCRVNGDLQKLRFENSNCSVTCIKILISSDYMVAAGTNHGTITVFQIPKNDIKSSTSQPKQKQKQIERFTINDLHSAPISSIEWSQNEYIVFSGDKSGVVVLTEIDFNLHISKSKALLNEQFEITQLSHSQQILLISTVYRSIICDASNSWKVRQVGTKERKILGKFGATFCHFQHGTVIYASRPGHRLWLADKTGTVQQTLIFKSAVQSNCPKIQLINPVVKKEPYDTSFGKVIQFGDNKLITYNSDILYILHPGAVSVVSVLNNARKILDLAVEDNEIFILEGERSLLRISPLPDKYTPDSLFQSNSRRTSFNLDEFAAKIKDTAVESLKKITKDLIITPEQNSPNSPPAVADEALELPPIVSLPAGTMPSIFASEDIEIHSSVSNNYLNGSLFSDSSSNYDEKNFPSAVNGAGLFAQDCQEDIVTRPLRKRRNRKQKNPSKSQDSMTDSTSNISEDRLVCGVVNDLSLSDESAFSQSHSSFSVLKDISTLLNQQKLSDITGNEDIMKTSDCKSQTSLDTCESVSERLLITSEMFREEQEKTFARLANQSLFDSFNSEKTDNMSISLNMTTSSSVSSKVSENLHSPSFTSENSRPKSTDSQSTDNYHNEIQQKEYWRSESNAAEENSSQEEKITGTESSVSSRNSQRERLYPRWSDEGERKDLVDDAIHNEDTFAEKFVDSEVINDVGICCGNENTSYAPDCPDGAFGEDNEAAQDLKTPVYPEHPSHCFNQFPLNGSTDSKKNPPTEPKTLSSLEPLSYGPPSGSSMLSSQPSSDFSSMTAVQPYLRDSFDHWPQYKTPERIISFAACKNYAICTDTNERVYYSNLTGLALSWTLLDYKGSMVKVSNDGSVVWLLNDKSIIALIDPSPKSPISSETVEIAENVKTFAIDSCNNEGWIVTLTGKIIHYSGVKESTQLNCDYIAVDIDCNNGMIVVLANDDTVLCKPPKEDSFRVIKTAIGKPSTSAIALGPGNLLWTAHDANNIYFSDDFLKEDPHWWRIQISDYIFQNSSRSFQNLCSKIKLNELKGNMELKKTMVATNENSVWIFHKLASTVYANKTGFTGYNWNKVSSVKLLPSIQWHKVSAEGVIEDKDRVWLLSLDGNIFCTYPNCRQFQSIPVPCEDKILCMASSVDTLWILSAGGRIHSRLGLTHHNISGTSWKELKWPQIDNLRLVWVSCGSDVAWACDVHGRTFITIGLQNRTPALDIAWIEVEGRPKDVQFEKVFVGSQLYMVWAIDTKRNLYVREGIFPHYQIGTNWVYVCGIEAVHVTISGTFVWALASNGNIYRRCGVSENNCIGDYWKSIPGNVKMISSSFTEELWGISQENKILKLSYNLKVLNGKLEGKEKELYSSKEDVSWEIVE